MQALFSAGDGQLLPGGRTFGGVAGEALGAEGLAAPVACREVFRFDAARVLRPDFPAARVRHKRACEQQASLWSGDEVPRLVLLQPLLGVHNCEGASDNGAVTPPLHAADGGIHRQPDHAEAAADAGPAAAACGHQQCG